MIDPGQFSPAETTIKVGEAVYVARLPLPRIGELQKARAVEVTWPDGARGYKVKPLGLIWVEHCQSGEYDAQDSWEVIRQALIGGEGGTFIAGEKKGEPAPMNRAVADQLMAEQVANWPIELRWRCAMDILIACCQGYHPEETADEGNGSAASSDGPPSITPQPSETVSSGESPPSA